jgi:membrane glycosyltransferase
MKPSNVETLTGARQAVFTGGSILITAMGFTLLVRSYAGEQLFWCDYIVIALFPLLFGQLAVGFVLTVFGFFDGMRGGDPLHVMRRPWRKNENEAPLAATAIVIPVFNEDVQRVSDGIANMWRSLEKTGQLEHFDFYLCSDSNNADRWVEEECAWLHLCRKLNAFEKLFYRKRRHAINSKSGNIADFCRRWGKRYRYMIILDADSVMAGATMVRLVRAMEANPEVGILQTQPVMVLGQSLFRRALQFSGSLYGRLFSEGCSAAQLSSGSYWGHNAVIRVAPFIEHCDLPLLPVPQASKRHVLSHDTVEAALMRRAGYEVWVAYEEGGTYEEGPPNISDMLTRDRRWCAGNLQHFWFLFARGIEMGNRLQIWIGLMAYLCSPIWFAFLVAGSISSYQRSRYLAYSAGPEDLGGTSHSATTILFFITMALLFTPRVLGILAALPRVRQFGGFFHLLVSAVAETLLSILIAPILMLFHSLFVLLVLLGWQIKWTSQNRSDTGLPFVHCVTLYGWQTLLGIFCQSLALTYLGFNCFWLLPIFLGWILAPFTAWITSSRKVGQWLRSHHFFAIPEEIATPDELQGLEGEDDAEDSKEPAPLWPQALLSPYIASLHLAMLRQRTGPRSDETPSPSMFDLRERLVREGPSILKPKEKLRLLWDAETVFWLHRELWSRPAASLHPDWNSLQTEEETTALLQKYPG